MLHLHKSCRSASQISELAEGHGSSLLGGSGGVVNSLDFCPASLKSLGCFYFRCLTFFTMEGGDNKFAKYTVPTLKAYLKVRSQNVSGNKQ